MKSLEFNGMSNEEYEDIARMIWSIEFIPYYPDIKEKYELTYLATIIFGFLNFWTSGNKKGRLYFKYSNFAKMLNVSEKSVKRGLDELSTKMGITFNKKWDCLFYEPIQ